MDILHGSTRIYMDLHGEVSIAKFQYDRTGHGFWQRNTPLAEMRPATPGHIYDKNSITRWLSEGNKLLEPKNAFEP